jgi:predicted RNA binding protein YcfA (HicA-like mRNA interferase family)
LSPKLPAVTARQVIRVAERLGFVLRQQRGSHALYYRDSDGARLVIPVHAGHDVPIGTLRGIIDDMGITPEQFAEML